MKKQSLGRGLGEIFKEVTASYDSEVTPENIKNISLEIPVNSITPNPYQPRKEFKESELYELSDSIKRYGLIQPIAVLKRGENDYTLIAGERRLRATKLLGAKNILAIVKDLDQDNIRELALIENIQREDLNPVELAYSYKELIDTYQISHEELSQIVNKSRTNITNILRLLSLSDYCKDKLISKEITNGHARTLIGLPEDRQKILVDTIIGQNLTVREAETLASKKSKSTSQKSLKTPDSEDILDIKNILDKFMLEYAIKNGKIIFNINSDKNIDIFKSFLQKVK